MSYNIINYDSSNLEILYDIHTSNGIFRANGRDIISDTSNYTLNTSNNISDRFNNSVFSQWTTNGTDINYIVGKVGIGTANPIAGELHISEPTGTVHGINNGTIILDHENNGGASSIVFRSKVNRTSDYGYIQYQDTSSVGGSGGSARLFIGTNDDTDDHICLMPSGNVGIGTATPLHKLHVQGDINYSGGLYLNNLLQSFASETYAVTTSNLLSTRLNNVYTKQEDDLYNTNTSNALSTRLNNVYTKGEGDIFNTNNSNYTLNTSNNISTRLNTLNADAITDGNNNKFIVNGIYSGNVNISGTLTANDLIIPGTITTLNTEVYVTEQLQILNSSSGTSLNIIQNNSIGDVFNASNLTSQVFTIKNNGNIGIGTNSPLLKLHVEGDINYTGGLFLNNQLQSFASETYAVATSNVISHRLNNEVFSQWNTVGSHINYTAGKVGIGTTNPTAGRLHIYEPTGTLHSANAGTIILDHGNQGGASSIVFMSNNNIGNDYGYIQYQDSSIANSGSNGGDSSKLIIGTGNGSLDDILLLPTGSVGIGTDTPLARLHIEGSIVSTSKFGLGITNPIAGRLHISEPIGTVHGVNTGTIILDHGNNGGASSIVFRSRVNIGSDYGYIQYQDASDVSVSGESARLIIGIQNETNDHVILAPSGNVGIGTNTPAEKLHVVGNIASTGSISSFYSDERLKEDIKKIESPLNIIENMKGFYYKPNELAKSFGINNDKREIGLSAQDVKRVLPEIVSLAPFDISRDSSNNIVSKSGEDYLTICYERMIPVIVEAIKELNNEIKELKKVNKELMENK